MAYMDFRGIEPAVATGPTPRLASIADHPVADQAAADFAPLEWTVISLARHERLSGTVSPGRAGRLLALLFGADITLPLADVRLEALRQVAVPLWHRLAPSAAALGRFEQRGFTAAQLDLLRANVAAIAGAAA